MTAPEPPIPYRHTQCRACRSLAGLEEVLSLGDLYLSDFPNSAGTKAHPPVPLTLMRCRNTAGAGCGLVQLQHTTPPDWLYRHFWYRSGVNETMVAELRDVASRALTWISWEPRETVIAGDIGANDGTLLRVLRELVPAGLQRPLLTVGWEPARNLYESLRPHANVVFPDYFRMEHPQALQDRAKILTAIAMFYDLDDPHAFLSDVEQFLHPEGVFVIQQAYLPIMLANTDFPNICHEHLTYYTLQSLEPLLAAHGLEVRDLEYRAINGGSLRTYVQWRGARGQVSDRVRQCRAEEAALFQTDEPFQIFRHRVGRVREQLQAILQAYHDQDAPVDLYAAATKGNTLLQYCGIDARAIRQCWERSPEKIGRYVGVSGIPVVAEETGRADPPSALLVGAWAFKEAFLKREQEYLAQGGRIILPLPAVEVVEGTVAGPDA